MKMLPIAILVTLAICPQVASAHPRQPVQAKSHIWSKKPAVKKIAYAGVPKARIRGTLNEQGLGPLAFARWLVAHPRLARVGQPGLRMTVSYSAILNRASPYFVMADADNDGGVSADELADFVAQRGANRRSSTSA